MQAISVRLPSRMIAMAVKATCKYCGTVLLYVIRVLIPSFLFPLHKPTFGSFHNLYTSLWSGVSAVHIVAFFKKGNNILSEERAFLLLNDKTRRMPNFVPRRFITPVYPTFYEGKNQTYKVLENNP
jgi:hypothetical protein